MRFVSIGEIVWVSGFEILRGLSRRNFIPIFSDSQLSGPCNCLSIEIVRLVSSRSTSRSMTCLPRPSPRARGEARRRGCPRSAYTFHLTYILYHSPVYRSTNGNIVIFLTISGAVKFLSMFPYLKSIKNPSFRYGNIVIILTMLPYNGYNVKNLTMFPYLLKNKIKS